MKTTLITALALCALSLPASAQRTGMINRSAPTIEQKMDLGSTGTLELTYVGINFGQGAFAKALKDEQRREQTREWINGMADKNPLGSFSCTQAVKIGETAVGAGDYKLAFKLNEKYEWELMLSMEGSKLIVPLPLMDAPDPSKRLVLSLYAGDADFTGGFYLAFGQKFTMLTIAPNPDAEQSL